MNQSTPLEADDFPWDLRVVRGYYCPICLNHFSSPGWCPMLLMGPLENLQAHPQVSLVPDVDEIPEK